MISFACPGCGQKLRVKEELAGKKAKCPRCAAVATIPTATVTSAGASGPTAPSPPVVPASLLPGERTRCQVSESPRTDGPTLPPGEEAVTQSSVDRLPSTTGTTAAEVLPELIQFLAPAQAADELGRLGPYRILSVLGHGGMGVVYLAEDPHLQRRVALKAMLPGLAATDSARQRFLREARAAAAIEHDHIVPIYHVGEERGVPFLAMPLLQGESLDERLRRAPPVPLPEALRIGREIAEGLQAAHERGLIHRDIKPANVWLEGKRGRVKILDFGLARSVGEDSQLTQQGALVGTPAYMAPEQAVGETLDGRADLFSLGCVLYRLTTGVPPFRQGDTIATLMAVATEKPVPPHTRKPDVPRPLSDLVMRLLEKHPKDRPTTAEEVVAVLRHSEGVPSVPPPIPLRPAGRKRRLGILGSAGAALVAAVLAFVFWPRGVQPAAEPLGPNPEAPTAEEPPTPVAAIGEAIAPLLLVSDPAPIAGLRSWTIETRLPRRGVRALACDPRTGRLACGSNEGVVRIYDPANGHLLRILLGHAREIHSLAWAPDGRTLASASEDGTARLWDPEAARCVHELKGHNGPVFSVAWSPDGGRVVTGGWDRTVRLWTAGGTPLRTLTGHPHRVNVVAWSPQGRRLASVGDGGVLRIWDTESGVLVYQLQKAAHFSWSPDGRRFATSQGPQLQVRDAETGEIAWHVRGDTYFLHSVAWSPDGRWLAGGCHDGSILKVWQADTGKRVWVAGCGKDYLAWSPDSKTLVNCEARSGPTQIRNALTGKVLREFGVHASGGDFAALSPDGALLAVNHLPGDVRIWDVSSGVPVRRLVSDGWGVESATWSPDGKRLGGVVPPTLVLRFWDTATGDATRTIPPPRRGNRQLAWSPDGKAVAAWGHDRGPVDLYRMKDGQWLTTLGEPDMHCYQVTWSPDSGLLAIGSDVRGQELRLWDSAPRKLRKVPTRGGAVRAVAFSPNGRTLASAGHGRGRVVKLWAMPDGQPLHTIELHRAAVNALAWSPDGLTLASWGEDDAVRLVDPKTGEVVRTLAGHARGVDNAAWSPDGRVLATLSDGVLRLWDSQSGNCLHHVRADALPRVWRAVSLVAPYLEWSPDGRTVLTRRRDGVVCCWDPATGRVRRVLVNLADGRGLAVSAAGHYATTPGVADELVYIGQTANGQETLSPAEFAQRYGWKNEPNAARRTGP